MKSETNRALVAKKKELHNPIPLGLPRRWKVITSTILLLFTMGIGQMWGAVTPGNADSKYLNIANYSTLESTYSGAASYSYDSEHGVLVVLPAAFTRYGTSQNWCTNNSGWTSNKSWDAPSENVFKGRTYYNSSSNAPALSVKGTQSTPQEFSFRVSNCTEVRALVNSSNTSRTISMTVYPVTGANYDTRGEAAGSDSDHSNAVKVLKVNGLSASSVYEVYITSNSSSESLVYELAFFTPVSSGPSISGFSPATGATVKSGTTVTVTGSTGSTIYYKWATSTQTADDIYNGGSGSHGTAEAATVTSSGINSANGTTLYAIARKGTTNSAVASASYTIDDTAPTFSSSTPANSATGVATSGTIVLTFSEALASVDGSKFTLTGATKGTVAIDGTDATKVNVAYSGAASEATVKLSVKAAAVADAAGNALAADLSDISFTTAAAAPCPTSGTVFSMAMKQVTDANKKALTADEQVNLGTADYATVAGGIATFTNLNAAKGKIEKGNPGYLNFNGNAAYLILDLDCKLNTSDSIIVTNTSANEMAFTTSATLDVTYQTETTDGKGVFVVPAALNNVDKIYCWRASSSTSLTFTAITVKRPAKYAMTFAAGEGGSGSMDAIQCIEKAEITLPACTFTAPAGKDFDAWVVTKTVGGASVTVSEGKITMPQEAVTATATWKAAATKYAVTYSLNGASGDAPTSPDKAEGDEVTLASAPSWTGYRFDGWVVAETVSGDPVAVSEGKFTMPAAAVTVTAQWTLLETKIYSLTGAIGSAEKTADNASVSESALVLSNSNGRIKLTPKTGETFKSGDVVTISGTIGNGSSADFGVTIYAANGSTKIVDVYVANAVTPRIATATLTADAEYVFLKRHGGTTTTLLTCEITRPWAEGTAAGISYATTEVEKLTTASAFTNPLTNNNNLVVVYGSSDNSVATIDANGQVTLVGAGTATITAKTAVQTKAGTLYAAGTASYTLTVAAPPTFAVTYANNGGDGTMTDSNSPYAEGAEVTLLDNTFTAPSGYAWSAWAVTETVSGNPVAVSEGKFTMPGVAVTVTAQWALIADFDVKFFQGYGDPDVQIGTTQSISTGGHAVAPADPERAGFAFLGWSTDGTEANIKDVATYGITTATNFTAMWKAVWTVTFDGAGAVIVEDGKKVASPDSPTQAGKVFQGWYNGESKYDFSAAVTGNLALESKWATADLNHFYYTYNDDFHFDGVVYKTPDGKTTDPEAAEASNVELATNPYTLFSGAAGITSIVATNGIYDYKKAAGTKHITAYLKLKADDATSNVVFTIASGYTAVLKLKMNGYSSNATISLKKGDDAVTPSGTQEGTAEGKNYGELTYNLAAGEYKLTTANKTLYISHIDLEATALPTHSVTYKPGDGEGAWVVDDDATEVADCPGTFTAPTGKVFNGWKNESDDSDVAVGAIVEDDMNLIAQWINHYAVTFNMNGHGGDAPAAQDIKHGAKAAKPADPSESGWDFGGWFTDNGTFEAPFDFNTPITAATPLYAKWTADPCPTPFSLSKVVLTSATDGTVTGYNGNEYAGEAVIGGLKDDDNTAEVDPSHEGVEEGYKLNGGGSGIVFATLKKGNFQEGDRVIVTITAKQNSYKIEEVSQDVLHIYYGTNASDATKLTTLESVSTAGSYTYRLKAADITAIGTKKGIGVFRESSNGQNPYVYSVEIKGCRSFAVMHTLTFKNIDGTATIAAEPLEEGAYASTVAPAAPKITMKRFLGWAEAVDGTPVDLTAYTITVDKTLYAVYEDIVCPTKGTVYSLAFDATATAGEGVEYTVNKNNGDVQIPASIAAISGGEAYFGTTANEDVKILVKDGETAFRANNSNNYIHLVVECPLQVGDTIAFTSSTTRELNFYKNAPSGTSVTSSSQKIIITNTEHALYGAEVIYIKGGNAACSVKTINITRPAIYDVTFDMMGHGGSAPAAIEDVLEGHKIEAPSPAPTDADYRFGGWYKDNTLESEWNFDNDVVTDNITLYAKWVDKSDATLKSLKYGTTEIALEAGVYTYAVNLSPLATDVPALTAVPSNPNATADVTNAAALDGEGHATSTVLVTPEEGGSPQTYKVNFTKLHIYTELADVTETTSWNWNGVATDEVKINDVAVRGLILANYIDAPNFEKLEGQENARAYRSNDYPAYQGTYLRFHATKPGRLTMNVRNSSGSPKLYVNGGDPIATLTSTRTDYNVIVPAGDVIITSTDGDMRIYNMTYKLLEELTPDYPRNVTEGRFGTICLPNGGVMVGADIFEVAYMDYQAGHPYKIYFDEVLNGEMVAGRPYVFLPQVGATQLGVFYTDALNADAGNYKGLYGSYTRIKVPMNDGNYILLNNQYYFVDTDNVYCGANKAYIKLADVPQHDPGMPAYGRRRISMGVNSENTATGMDELNASETPVKIMIDGTMYILRGEKMYDATGRLVK